MSTAHNNLHSKQLYGCTEVSRKSSGFTLIEAMVTVFVLAIGFLGLAGLQLTALQNNSSAYERSQASILVYDIVDRIRANRTSALNGDYDVAVGDAPTATDCRGSGTNCNAVQLAAFDLNQWKCSLGGWNDHASCAPGALDITGKLPNGDGSIAINGSQVTISVQWVDNRYEEAAADKLTTFTITTTL